MKEMQNGKALGPDGFNMNFFKACWRILKQDVLEVVEDSRRFKTVLKALNESFIALIPKQEEATSPNRFRPIAFCNVIYKIISKVISNHIKPLLPTLVSKKKTGYVEGRQILDNIFQAHGMVHSLITNKQAGIIMQLDIVKAYEKNSWSYIRAILKSYGFDYNWIKWVMALVTIASYSILLNGSPSKTFKPSRGLRQGDPLSPFIFILIIEGLRRAIRAAKEEGRIQGLRLTQGGDMVTHQQFIDETMLQDTSTVKEAKAFKQILSEFSRVAGTQGKGEEKKKWDLVAWDRVCKPKSHDGLGLHDLRILNRVLGAKIWWRWLKEIQAPWVKLWKQKYAKELQEKNLIIMTRQVKGSVIWNREWVNRALVQNHNFWEIKNGNLAWFWEDN
eukprot:PITA_29948